MLLPLLAGAAAAGVDAAFMQPIRQAPVHAERTGTVTGAAAAAAGGGSGGQREAGGSRSRRRCSSLACAGCHRPGARPVGCVSKYKLEE